MKNKIIDSNNALYNDINNIIDKILKARINKDVIQEQKAYFEMESLMVATLQQLNVNNDFLLENVK